MIEIVKILEKLGITIIEEAAPELVVIAKAEGILLLNQFLSAEQYNLKKFQIAQHMATFGHGLLKFDVEVAATEAVIVCLNAAIDALG